MMSVPGTPIDVVPLFPGERAALLELLDGLPAEQWRTLTVCVGWSVQDIAAHLLGDDVGFVSSWRDGHRNPSFADGLDISTWEGLLAAIDRQNAEWVQASRRMSPALLCELLRIMGEQFAALVSTLDPEAPAGPVDWVGPEPAPVWLHLAREYSERWVHQQQIRDAVRRPGLTERQWLGPIIATFVLAVPQVLNRTPAAPGVSVRLVVDSESGGSWRLVREPGGWQIDADTQTPSDTEVVMDADTAWRLFTKGISPADAARVATLRGDPRLTAAILETVAVLA